MTFHLTCVHIIVDRLGMLRGQNAWIHRLNVSCLFVIFIYFPFWFLERDLAFDCSSFMLIAFRLPLSASLLFPFIKEQIFPRR